HPSTLHGCSANASSCPMTPVTNPVAQVPLVVSNASLALLFILWPRGRHADGVASTDRPTLALPTLRGWINGKLTLARGWPMSRLEPARPMKFVEQSARFVFCRGAKQVLDGERPEPKRLSQVFAAHEQSRERAGVRPLPSRGVPRPTWRRSR